MKKKLLLTVLCASMVFSLTACGENKEEHSTESSSQMISQNDKGMSSIAMNIDPEKQVKELCDYSAITVTLEGDYEVTQEQIDEFVNSLLSSYGLGTVEVTDRNIIQQGDIVNVDYTGYWNGEAFENGSAQGAMLTITEDSGYIPGFVEGLVGAKVGETIRNDVTFPEVYQNNPDLAGQLTTFEFKINGIYRQATLDEISDETIAANFEELYGVTTAEGLVEFVKNYLEQSAASSKASEGISAVKDYVAANSTVEIPEDYLAQRVEEYKESFIADQLTEGEDLETFLKETYGLTVEQAMEEWRTYEEEQITQELLFRRIAQLEGIEMDEEEYAAYIQGFITSYSGRFADEEALYEYFGNGNKEDGKAYLNQLYFVNKAIDLVCEKATINEKQ